MFDFNLYTMDDKDEHDPPHTSDGEEGKADEAVGPSDQQSVDSFASVNLDVEPEHRITMDDRISGKPPSGYPHLLHLNLPELRTQQQNTLPQEDLTKRKVLVGKSGQQGRQNSRLEGQQGQQDVRSKSDEQQKADTDLVHSLCAENKQLKESLNVICDLMKTMRAQGAVSGDTEGGPVNVRKLVQRFQTQTPGIESKIESSPVTSRVDTEISRLKAPLDKITRVPASPARVPASPVKGARDGITDLDTTKGTFQFEDIQNQEPHDASQNPRFSTDRLNFDSQSQSNVNDQRSRFNYNNDHFQSRFNEGVPPNFGSSGSRPCGNDGPQSSFRNSRFGPQSNYNDSTHQTFDDSRYRSNEGQTNYRQGDDMYRDTYRDSSQSCPGRQPFVWKTFPDHLAFSGQDETVNFGDWLKKFDLLCQVNGCVTDDQKADTLMLALKGDASYFLLNIPNFRQLTYRCLCAKLEERFGVDLAIDKRRLLKRRKAKDESWQHMAEDMYRLAKSVYNGDEKLAEREAKFLFIRALPDNLRIHIAASNPHTLADAVANVTQLCAIEDIAEKQTHHIKFAKTDDNEADQKPKVNSNRRPRKKFDMSKVKCYTCQKFGHFARNCPAAKEDLQVKSENSKESQS